METCVLSTEREAKRQRLLLMAGAVWFLFLRRRRRNRTIWTRDWLLRRDDLGAYDTLLSELREEDKGSFLNFLRVTPELFDEMVRKVAPYIQKEDTVFRKSISPGMRLAITLRYLATGNCGVILSAILVGPPRMFMLSRRQHVK
jgi:hypothetical protein